MNERMRESLSALMDDEANEIELERVLSSIGGDDELRMTWTRYHAARSAVVHSAPPMSGMDISGRVRAALAEQPETSSGGTRRRLASLTQPLAGLAVAASVAAVVVVGGMQLNDVEATAGSPPVVAVSPPGMVGPAGGVAVPAGYSPNQPVTLQPTPATGYRELARQRMQRYMQSHAEAAALNSPNGLLPFARVNEIKER